MGVFVSVLGPLLADFGDPMGCREESGGWFKPRSGELHARLNGTQENCRFQGAACLETPHRGAVCRESHQHLHSKCPRGGFARCIDLAGVGREERPGSSPPWGTPAVPPAPSSTPALPTDASFWASRGQTRLCANSPTGRRPVSACTVWVEMCVLARARPLLLELLPGRGCAQSTSLGLICSPPPPACHFR